MPIPYHGSCLCGEVTFEVNLDPVVVSCCHCSNCKKYTGTVFSTNIVFPPGSITMTKGESLVHTFRDTFQDSGNVLVRHSCQTCAAPLFVQSGEDGSGGALAVFYSALDDFDREGDGKEKPPQVEFYAKDRVAWVNQVQGAQQAKTKPGRDD